ncbi:glycosyltransferase family 2 protein [Siccirubricoccus sp. KC 17139]|uniref:Glycosyltransferase family 2 protein n=1 Tax=Siccirubricoccus soli TaxID=2899147 RepID=A0ABT1D7U4_9PROT|nr:glycosyltransferase family 2 protein [Siccirubricoccus soli]MCO6417993.1 glycosyltransferase family 2 protein [Siccirubricoccus soli]MCP2684128.1 glycosyltransferase family 2 protein [Siccirubricoccus soli]
MAAAEIRGLVLIPSYNTGAILLETVRGARRAWAPVWVVIDGSTDGSDALLAEAMRDDPEFRLIRLPANGGKGAAVLAGLREAAAAGFTHALVMDADGQHPAEAIGSFMAAAAAEPAALILGRPVFGPEAPQLRVRGRRISNWWANLETLGAGIGDSLFGFRVYPIAPLLRVMQRGHWMRRFDFDPEAAVRLAWAGLKLVNLPAPVRYLRAEEGGVSHFNYGRDNLLLTWMHTRLVLGMVARLPMLLARRLRRGPRMRAGSRLGTQP